MSVSLRLSQRVLVAYVPKRALVALIGASAVAGCSADVSRFDLGSTSFSETSSTSQASTYGSNPAFATSARDQGSGYGSPYGGSSVARSELAPPPPAAQGQLTTAAIDQRPQTPTYQTQGYPAEQYAPQNSPISAGSSAPRGGKSAAIATEKGQEIEVKSGDTLYKISREHQVSVADLMSVNDLKSPSIKPGQKLYLPSQKMASAKSPGKAAIKLPKTETAPAVASASAPSDWTGSYTVKQGDSLYQVARDHKVKLTELQTTNGISDARKVKPGTVLKVPGSGSSTASSAGAGPGSTTASSGSSSGTGATETARVQPGSGIVPPAVPSQTAGTTAASTPSATSTPAETPAATSQSVQPTILNSAAPGEQKVAAVTTPNIASDASPSGAAQAANPGSGSVASKLRWPVQGKVVQPFGPKSDGTHNDGVNIAAPVGTDVKAADGGVVAYAGDELKGYGNLVLVRHDNGWVTAYAHADRILVSRGDHVKRGQVIAKTGRTGQVDQPQLHFELRQGQKPVDPTPFMEKM